MWPPEPHRSPGIDWREAEQLELCRELFGKQSRLHFPLTATPSPSDYFIDNGAYPAPGRLDPGGDAARLTPEAND